MLRALVLWLLDRLYTTFAWAYDVVAAAVSFGEWHDWGRCALQFLPQRGRVLEIGHGPGHLFVALRACGIDVVGVDRSWQMARRLRERLRRAALAPALHAQADARALPFADRCFDAAVWTFPTAAVFDAHTLRAVWRVLCPGGVWVIVLSATPHARLLRAIYRLTGQSQREVHAAQRRFAAAGFSVAHHVVRMRHASVSVFMLTRPS